MKYILYIHIFKYKYYAYINLIVRWWGMKSYNSLKGGVKVKRLRTHDIRIDNELAELNHINGRSIEKKMYLLIFNINNYLNIIGSCQ